MPTGVTDATDLLEVGLRTSAEPVHECLQRMCVGSILCIELAQLRLRAAHDKLGERRSVRAQPSAKRLERRGKRRSLGDRMSRM